jgi:hypothetical protein
MKLSGVLPEALEVDGYELHEEADAYALYKHQPRSASPEQSVLVGRIPRSAGSRELIIKKLLATLKK